MTTTTPLAGRAASDADYERLGLSHGTISPWEDGARTDGGRGSFEWWYFDAHLDDGASLVVIFMNKDFTQPHKPLAPVIRINLDLPDGQSFEKSQTFAPEEYSAATDHADVRIGSNRFEGDLHRYRITAAIDNVSVDITLTGQDPLAAGNRLRLLRRRPGASVRLAPVRPTGNGELRYRVGDEINETAGVGYHDRDWGNAALTKLIHDWYWARGQAGPYSVITAYETAHKNYGYAPIVSFMLARDGHVVAGDAAKVTFAPEDVRTDDKTGKPVANVLRYTYEDGDDRYVVTYTRQRTSPAAR